MKFYINKSDGPICIGNRVVQSGEFDTSDSLPNFMQMALDYFIKTGVVEPYVGEKEAEEDTEVKPVEPEAPRTRPRVRPKNQEKDPEKEPEKEPEQE